MSAGRFSVTNNDCATKYKVLPPFFIQIVVGKIWNIWTLYAVSNLSLQLNRSMAFSLYEHGPQMSCIYAVIVLQCSENYELCLLLNE
jgi:hypothetical protein